MTAYPGAIYAPRTKANKVGIVYDPTKTTVGFAEDVTKLDDEVVAIETELGLDPKGSSASVLERIKGIKSLSDATTDIVTIKGAFVGIGKSSPVRSLDIVTNDASHQGIFITNQSTSTGARCLISFSVSGTTEDCFCSYRCSADKNDFAIGTTPALSMSLWTAATQRLTILATGGVGIGTVSPTALLDINSDVVRLRTAKTPASATDTGNAGDICWDSGFLYVCVATNSWKKVAIAAW